MRRGVSLLGSVATSIVLGAALLSSGQQAGATPSRPGPLKVSVADASATEVDAGTSALRFRIRLSAKPRQPVRVAYRTQPGSASAAEDFVATTGTVRLTPRRPSRVVTIEVVGDDRSEGPEQMYLSLARVRGPAQLGDALGTGQIADDDPVVTPDAGPASLTVLTFGSPAGYGLVRIMPGNLVCNNGTRRPCVFTFAAGTEVTLTADPNNTETTFTGWSGACLPAGTNPVCRLTVRGSMGAIGGFAGE
ncbi:Calx-beta domain-containing protein [Nocardioides sp. LHD-245]|uniref:Calx-beta domain-containing protein n=1 Tax=Nocardioides sp. LHD-245 TaxID=3051387 RepID=UPI0027E00F9D|nr:Calx-beta domain-containing protein [Nocardioides sp. LHD-245]